MKNGEIEVAEKINTIRKVEALVRDRRKWVGSGKAEEESAMQVLLLL
jgi:hypothetical protein